MKRMFVLFAFLLVSCAAFAQEEKPQSEGTLLVVPRLDLAPSRSAAGDWNFDFGSTSLYTLFEGNIGSRFSFSVCNHWFAYTSEWSDFTGLYTNTWRSDASNWVDWANVTASFGNFFLTLGKDYINIATYEINANDYDSHWQMNSTLWNEYQVYQWGGKFGWTSNDERTTISLQMTTDMTMQRPFENRHFDGYAYTFHAAHEWETASLMASVTRSDWLGWMGAASAQFTLSDALALGIDASVGQHLSSGALRLDAAVSDRVELAGKIGYEWLGGEEWSFEKHALGRLFGGVACNWYPLRDSRDLRLHLMAAPSLLSYRSSGDRILVGTDLYFSAGATYFFEFKLF